MVRLRARVPESTGLLVAAVLALAAGAAQAAVLSPGDILVLTSAELFRVDPATGARSVVSDATTDGGPVFDFPVGVGVTSGGRLLVFDAGLDAVLEVDPASGDRAQVSTGLSGFGPLLWHGGLEGLRSGGVTADGRAYLTTWTGQCSVHPPCFVDDWGLQLFDPETGNGELVVGRIASIFVASSGYCSFLGPAAAELGGRLLVVSRCGPLPIGFDPLLDGIVRIDPANMQADLVAGGGGGFPPKPPVGVGADMPTASGLAFDPPGTAYTISESRILAIDVETGDRTVVALADGFGLVREAAGRLLYLSGDSIFRVDVATGTPTLVTDGAVGPDPLMLAPRALHVVPEPAAAPLGLAVLASLAALRRRRDDPSRASG